MAISFRVLSGQRIDGVVRRPAFPKSPATCSDARPDAPFG